MNDDGPAPTSEVLKSKGLIGVELAAKGGLSLINGTSQMYSFLSNSENILSNLLPLADIIVRFTGGEECSIQPMDARVHQARPHHGQSLWYVTSIMRDSDILKSHVDCDKVQDAYSFKCIPKYTGQFWKTIAKCVPL